MEKPYSNLPKEIKLPKLRLPSIALPSLQGVPLPGTPEFYYKQAEDERKKRASEFFNTNDPNEVNSWADVITNTATDLFTAVGNADFGGIMDAVGNTVIDSWNVLNRGTIQPILNRDADVLKHNTWVNFMETADVLDNLWKGFAIPILQDKRGLSAGVEGFKGALFGRENYNWDTGSTALDLIMEMATPANILLLGSTTLAKGLGKAAFKSAGGTVQAGKLGVDAGTSISKKAMKTFARAYTGSAGEAIRTVAQRYNISPAAASILQDAAVHSMNMKIISSLNKVTKLVDAVDSFGPKVALTHTFMPLKLTYQGGKWGINMINKYVADAYTRSAPYDSVISFVANEGQLIRDMTAVEAAAKMNGEAYDATLINKRLSDIARKDLKEFDNVFRASYNAAYRTDIDSVIEGTTQTAGSIQALSDALDQAAVKLAGGLDVVKNFDDYFAIIQRLQYAKQGNTGLETLYKSLYRMRNVREGLKANDLAKGFDEVKLIIDASYLKRLDNMRNEIKLIEEDADAYIQNFFDRYKLNYPQAVRLVRTINKEVRPLNAMELKRYEEAVDFINDITEMRTQMNMMDETIKATERGEVPDTMKMLDVESLAAIERHLDAIEDSLRLIPSLDDQQRRIIHIIENIRELSRMETIESSIKINKALVKLNEIVLPKSNTMTASEAFQHYFKQAIPLHNVNDMIEELAMLSEKAENSPVNKGDVWQYDVNDIIKRHDLYDMADELDDDLAELNQYNDIAMPDILEEMRGIIDQIRRYRDTLKPEDDIPTKEWQITLDLFRDTSNALRNRIESLAATYKALIADRTNLNTTVGRNKLEQAIGDLTSSKAYETLIKMQDLILPEAHYLVEEGVDGFVKSYVFQTAKLFKSLQLVNTPEMSKILDAMDDYNSEDVGVEIIRMLAKLPHISPEVSQIIDKAQRVLTTLEGLNSIRNFYGEVIQEMNAGVIPHVIGLRYLDAIQSFYNRPALLVDEAYPSQDWWINQILNNVEDQLSNVGKWFNAKLESATSFIADEAKAGRLKPEVQAIYDKLKGPNHMAQYDVRMNYVADVFYGRKYPGFHPIYEDIETTSLNSHQGIILQDAVYDAFTGLTHSFINVQTFAPDPMISDTVYRILYDDVDLENAKYIYNKVHREGDLDFINKQFNADDPTIIIYPCYGEDDLLRQRDLFQKGIRDTGPAIKTVMWNGIDFDSRFLNTKISKYDKLNPDWQLRYVGISEIEDTRIWVENQNGIQRLNMNYRDKLYEYTQRFLEMRASEITHISMEMDDKIRMTRIEMQHQGMFIPSIDLEFRQDLDDLMNQIDGIGTDVPRSGEVIQLFEDIQGAMAGKPFMNSIKSMQRGIHDTLISFKKTDRFLNKIHTDTEIMKFFADDKFFRGMPDYMTSQKNVTAMIEHYLTRKRIPHGVINVKMVKDPELMLNWFKLDGVKLTKLDTVKILDLARKVQRTAEHVDLVDNVNEYAIELTSFIQDALVFIKESLGTHYFGSMVQYLRIFDGNIKSFAVAHTLYNMAHSLAQGQKLLNNPKYLKLMEYPEDLVAWLKDPSLLRWKPDRDIDLFHHLSYLNDDMEKVIEYLGPLFENEITSVEAFIRHGDDTVRTAKLKRVAAMFRPIIQVFNDVNKFAESLATDGVRAVYYNNLRLTFEAYDNQIAYAKLRHFLQMDPQTMRRYLWQYSQEYMLTTRNALFSDSYFKKRNMLKSEDIISSDELFVRFQEILKDKKAFKDAGIEIFTRGEDILFKLDARNIDELNALEPLRLDEDFIPPYTVITKQLQELLDKAQQPELAEKLITEIEDARRAMIELTSDGATTTFEKMDLGIFKEIDKRVGSLSGRLPETDDLLRHNRFDHSMFNHSVLGDIDSRRKFMPGTSFNPIKRMYNAMSMAHNKVATQDQFLATALDESTTVDKFIRSTRDKEDLVEYMKANYMQTRLVFMAQHAKKGYELKTIYINSVADVDFAIKMHAVPMDINTFNKAYQLINRNRVPEGWLKFVDKMFVVPYKIGYLALNPAFIMRNIIDAGMKNIITAGDLSMVPKMFQMTKTYVQYKHTTQTILEYARYSGKSVRYAADDVFNGTARIDGNLVTATVTRDDYDLISMFKIDGASTGLVAEMKREMGDAVDKVYHRLGGEQGTLIDIKTFRMIMEAPDDVAEGILKRYFPNPQAYRFLMDEKRRLYFYKRGYEMLKHYPKADISVDEIVMYLQRPDRILPQHQEAMTMMLEKTKHFSMNQDLYDKVMSHPLLSTTMDLNGGVEEIMRLTLFKHMIESGASYSQATAAVVKTHFDYAHKSQAQMYMEMVFPFSTFRLNNLLYWMDALSHHPQLIDGFRDTAEAVFGVSDYTPEQREWYMALDYHITAGNIRFTRDEVSAWGIEIPKGQEMALKVNPSVMDVFEFATDPYNYIASALNTTVQTVQNLYELKPYEGETDASFKQRKDKLLFQLMPIIGPHLLRMKAKFSDNPMMNLALAPFFSLLKVPQPYKPYVKRYFKKKTYTPFKRYQYSKARRYRLPRITRPNRLYYSTYSTFNKWYYGTPTIRRGGRTYMAQNSRSWNRTFSDIHGRSVSRTGRPKYRFLAFPTDKWTMPIKIALLRNISNHIRYSY